LLYCYIFYHKFIKRVTQSLNQPAERQVLSARSLWWE